MRIYKIKDNSRDILPIDSPLVLKIKDKTVKQLEKEGVLIFPETIKETEELDEEQFVLKSENGKFRTENLMGVLGCNDERLVIQSRFCKSENDFFLRYLLEKVLEYPNVVDFCAEAESGEHGIDLLAFIFPKYLKNAMHKGLLKMYVRKEYNDSNPKGMIDVARHIKNNVPFMGKFAYTQREYSGDNYLIELIRHTIECIKIKKYGCTILKSVKDEVEQIVEVTTNYRIQDRKKVLEQNKKRVVRHAYFAEYRVLQQICYMILSNQYQNIGTGKNGVYGILFDGAWLWEEYVNTLISEKFYHPQNRKNRYAQHLFDGKGRIFPDFISKEEKVCIADAKYKRNENIGNRDYLQVIAYMYRFDCKKGMYLYPDINGEEKELLYMKKGRNVDGEKEEHSEEVVIIKQGLTIPVDVRSYDEFCEQMGKNEKIFKESVFQ